MATSLFYSDHISIDSFYYKASFSYIVSYNITSIILISTFTTT